MSSLAETDRSPGVVNFCDGVPGEMRSVQDHITIDISEEVKAKSMRECTDQLKKLEAMGEQAKAAKYYTTSSHILAGLDNRTNSPLDLLGRNVSLLAAAKRYSTACSAFSVTALLIVTLDYLTPHPFFAFSLTIITLFHIGTTSLLYLAHHRRTALWKPEWHRDSFNTYDLVTLTIEAVIISLHKLPYSTLPDAVNLFVFVRLFTLLRTLRDMSFASSASSILVGALCNIKMDALFVYKTRLFSSPILTMTITSGAGFVLLSFLTWFVESQYGELNLAQSFWFTFVTATTVGYGDYTPASVGGKLVGMLSALYGIIVTAILVSVVQHKLTMTGIQKQIILFLAEVKRVQQTKQKAAHVVGLAMIYYRALCCVGRVQAIPPHKTYSHSKTATGNKKVLFRAWLNLQEAINDMRVMRRQSNTSWASISVLDVLHADSSDILAQNTVLQYLMRPADEGLSAMLRVGKHKPMVNMKRKQSEVTTPVVPRLSMPCKMDDNMGHQGRLSANNLGIFSFGKDDAFSATSRSSRGDVDDLDPSNSITESDTASNTRSRGSITSLVSQRTAHSTAAMVDMLKIAVVGGTVGVQKKPARYKMKKELDVAIDNEDALSACSASPRRLRGDMAQSRRVEQLLLHMMKEMNIDQPPDLHLSTYGSVRKRIPESPLSQRTPPSPPLCSQLDEEAVSPT
eukprot:TRINITY_DN10737_c0_g1_i1.p1 TRINITY_DN10737_c0_g1~~TRINITY_DN10737_c0_g1_i1.p1  ORF type:complete len:684 (+),score=145.09 TRINITY_DN10737_c0_g1_i1:89-2140(+)